MPAYNPVRRRPQWLAASAVLTLTGPLAWAATATYTVGADAALTRLDVRACFADTPPQSLRGASRRASQLLERAVLVRGGERRVLRSSGRTLNLSDAEAGDCVEYRVRLEASQDQWASVRRWGGAVLAPSSLFLWRPSEPQAQVELRFALPADFEISAPWPELPGKAHSYRLTDAPASWDDQVAIGRLERFDLPVKGGRLRVALVGELGDYPDHRFQTWLAEAAGAVGGLYGRWPQPETQVLVLASRQSRSAVPWGQVLRGGSPAVLFVVNPDRSLADYRADWTAVHEFAHLLLPYVSRNDAWVSEGIASYYQNLLRARAGMLTPADAWSKLWAGFNRGRQATNAELTLAEATRERYGGNLMRVYWSGAALALEADIELRRHPGSTGGLDVVLDRLSRCCLEPGRLWRGEQLFRKLDELAGTEFLEPLYWQYAGSRQFPDVGALYRALGIEPDGESVHLRGDTLQRSLRTAIDGSATHVDDVRAASTSLQRDATEADGPR